MNAPMGSAAQCGALCGLGALTRLQLLWSYELRAVLKRFGCAVKRYATRPGGSAVLEVALAWPEGPVRREVLVQALVPSGYPAKPPVLLPVDRRGGVPRPLLAQLGRCLAEAASRAAAAGGPAVFFALDCAVAVLRAVAGDAPCLAPCPLAGAAGAGLRRPGSSPGSTPLQQDLPDAMSEQSTAASAPAKAAVAATAPQTPRGRRGKQPWAGQPALQQPPGPQQLRRRRRGQRPQARATHSRAWGVDSECALQAEAGCRCEAASCGYPTLTRQSLQQFCAPTVESGELGVGTVGGGGRGAHLDSHAFSCSGSSSSTSSSDIFDTSSSSAGESSSDSEDLDDEMQRVNSLICENIQRQLLLKGGHGQRSAPARRNVATGLVRGVRAHGKKLPPIPPMP